MTKNYPSKCSCILGRFPVAAEIIKLKMVFLEQGQNEVILSRIRGMEVHLLFLPHLTEILSHC